MTKVILIIMYICGQPDTVIVKRPDAVPMYTHNINDPRYINEIVKIMKGDPIIIKYEEDRGHCA